MMCTVAPHPMHKGRGTCALTLSVVLQEPDDLLRAINYPRLHTSPGPMRLASCAPKRCPSPIRGEVGDCVPNPVTVFPEFRHMYRLAPLRLRAMSSS
jgi:hypothetical protein